MRRLCTLLCLGLVLGCANSAKRPSGTYPLRPELMLLTYQAIVD